MRYYLTVITVTLLILGSQIHRLLEFVLQSSHKRSIVIQITFSLEQYAILSQVIYAT